MKKLKSLPSALTHTRHTHDTHTHTHTHTHTNACAHTHYQTRTHTIKRTQWHHTHRNTVACPPSRASAAPVEDDRDGRAAAALLLRHGLNGRQRLQVAVQPADDQERIGLGAPRPRVSALGAHSAAQHTPTLGGRARVPGGRGPPAARQPAPRLGTCGEEDRGRAGRGDGVSKSRFFAPPRHTPACPRKARTDRRLGTLRPPQSRACPSRQSTAMRRRGRPSPPSPPRAAPPTVALLRVCAYSAWCTNLTSVTFYERGVHRPRVVKQQHFAK